MHYQDYILLRIYLGPTPFQSLSLVTTVNWGATGKSDRFLDSQSRRKRSDTAIGVGYLSTIKYDETIKVNSVTIWIRYEVFWFIKRDSTPSTAISKANSLFCPSRIPISRDRLGFSPAYTSSFWNTQGFTASTAEAMITAGNTRSANIPILKLAPREKKNRIKKKSRRGFKLSAINKAIGRAARVTPAMKAPISCDRPKAWAN